MARIVADHHRETSSLPMQIEFLISEQKLELLKRPKLKQNHKKVVYIVTYPDERINLVLKYTIKDTEEFLVHSNLYPTPLLVATCPLPLPPKLNFKGSWFIASKYTNQQRESYFEERAKFLVDVRIYRDLLDMGTRMSCLSTETLIATI